MSTPPPSDALVFFGATGDLAYKQIFVEGHGSFYEETGAIRDVVQNHMLPLVAILATDPPAGRDAEAIRQEPGMASDSNVETFAAVSPTIHGWRWPPGGWRKPTDLRTASGSRSDR